jgi:hypothetical protein
MGAFERGRANINHNRDGCATFKPRAIPSIEAATLQIFRASRVFRGQKKILITDQWKKSTAFLE